MLPFSGINQASYPICINEETWIKAIVQRLDQCVADNNQLRSVNVKLARRDKYDHKSFNNHKLLTTIITII